VKIAIHVILLPQQKSQQDKKSNDIEIIENRDTDDGSDACLEIH
jgi:hypothetical protein